MKPPPFVRCRRQAAGEQVPFVLAQTANVSYPADVRKVRVFGCSGNRVAQLTWPSGSHFARKKSPVAAFRVGQVVFGLPFGYKSQAAPLAAWDFFTDVSSISSHFAFWITMLPPPMACGLALLMSSDGPIALS